LFLAVERKLGVEIVGEELVEVLVVESLMMMKCDEFWEGGGRKLVGNQRR